MDDSTTPPLPIEATLTPLQSAARIVGAIVLLMVGMVVFLGGIVVHFAQRAEKIVLFPFAGRLLAVFGLGILVVGVVMAGRRGALWFGGIALASGFVLFLVGFLSEEVIFRQVRLAGAGLMGVGGLVIWATNSIAKEIAAEKAKGHAETSQS